jgi:hypothetical protein
MAASLHTPWSVDCGSIVMGGEVVASRVAPDAATREDVAAIHALIVAAPDLMAFVGRIARQDPVFAKGHEKRVIADARELFVRAGGRL